MSGPVVVHGLGYVGLTNAVHRAMAGQTVIGYDPDPEVVAAVNLGRPKAGEFLGYLAADVEELVARGLLEATTDRPSVLGALTHFVSVPTERQGDPWDEVVRHVMIDLLRSTPEGALICVESTLTPGTTDAVMKKLKEAERAQIGVTKFLAVCPRRDWFADPRRNLKTLPRVIGGVTPACTERAAAACRGVSDDLLLTDYRTAELTKSLENALLHLPVMFAHQLAYAMPDWNVAEALRLASTHWRFESMGPLYLGLGVGGRCVPLGTQYLLQAAGEELRIGAEVVAFDRRIRKAIANRVLELRPERVLVLGMAYRPEFKDAGLSPGLAVATRLQAAGVVVEVHDPMWSQHELEQLTQLRVAKDVSAERWRTYDVIVLATPHAAYASFPSEPDRWRAGQAVLDGQGAWAAAREALEAAGVKYLRVGAPGWRTKGGV